jgi:hypothetical protein
MAYKASGGFVQISDVGVTLVKPAGALATDVLIAVLATNRFDTGGTTLQYTTPAGWQPVKTPAGQPLLTGVGVLAVYAALGNVATTRFDRATGGGSESHVGCILSFDGRDQSLSFPQAAFSVDTTQVLTAVNVTATGNEDELIVFVDTQETTAWLTAPAGTTDRANNAGGAFGISMVIGTKDNCTAGAQGGSRSRPTNSFSTKATFNMLLPIPAVGGSAGSINTVIM